jgi:hypothetical protein
MGIRKPRNPRKQITPKLLRRFQGPFPNRPNLAPFIVYPEDTPTQRIWSNNLNTLNQSRLEHRLA